MVTVISGSVEVGGKTLTAGQSSGVTVTEYKNTKNKIVSVSGKEKQQETNPLTFSDTYGDTVVMTTNTYTAPNKEPAIVTFANNPKNLEQSKIANTMGSHTDVSYSFRKKGQEVATASEKSYTPSRFISTKKGGYDVYAGQSLNKSAFDARTYPTTFTTASNVIEQAAATKNKPMNYYGAEMIGAAPKKKHIIGYTNFMLGVEAFKSERDKPMNEQTMPYLTSFGKGGVTESFKRLSRIENVPSDTLLITPMGGTEGQMSGLPVPTPTGIPLSFYLKERSRITQERAEKDNSFTSGLIAGEGKAIQSVAQNPVSTYVVLKGMGWGFNKAGSLFPKTIAGSKLAGSVAKNTFLYGTIAAPAAYYGATGQYAKSGEYTGEIGSYIVGATAIEKSMIKLHNRNVNKQLNDLSNTEFNVFSQESGTFERVQMGKSTLDKSSYDINAVLSYGDKKIKYTGFGADITASKGKKTTSVGTLQVSSEGKTLQGFTKLSGRTKTKGDLMYSKGSWQTTWKDIPEPSKTLEYESTRERKEFLDLVKNLKKSGDIQKVDDAYELGEMAREGTVGKYSSFSDTIIFPNKFERAVWIVKSPRISIKDKIRLSYQNIIIPSEKVGTTTIAHEMGHQISYKMEAPEYLARTRAETLEYNKIRRLLKDKYNFEIMNVGHYPKYFRKEEMVAELFSAYVHEPTFMKEAGFGDYRQGLDFYKNTRAFPKELININTLSGRGGTIRAVTNKNPISSNALAGYDGDYYPTFMTTGETKLNYVASRKGGRNRVTQFSTPKVLDIYDSKVQKVLDIYGSKVQKVDELEQGDKLSEFYAYKTERVGGKSAIDEFNTRWQRQDIKPEMPNYPREQMGNSGQTTVQMTETQQISQLSTRGKLKSELKDVILNIEKTKLKSQIQTPKVLLTTKLKSQQQQKQLQGQKAGTYSVTRQPQIFQSKNIQSARTGIVFSPNSVTSLQSPLQQPKLISMLNQGQMQQQKQQQRQVYEPKTIVNPPVTLRPQPPTPETPFGLFLPPMNFKFGKGSQFGYGGRKRPQYTPNLIGLVTHTKTKIKSPKVTGLEIRGI